MRNHSKSQKNIKRHGNETRITQKNRKKTESSKNQKETSEDNRQNPPLDLILSRIQRSLQKLRHGKMARNNPLPCSDVGLHHPSFLG